MLIVMSLWAGIVFCNLVYDDGNYFGVMIMSQSGYLWGWFIPL